MVNLRQVLDLPCIVLLGIAVPENFQRNFLLAALFLCPDCLKDIAKTSESEFLSNQN